MKASKVKASKVLRRAKRVLSAALILGLAGGLMLAMASFGFMASDWRVGFLGPGLASIFGAVGLFIKADRAIADAERKEA